MKIHFHDISIFYLNKDLLNSGSINITKTLTHTANNSVIQNLRKRWEIGSEMKSKWKRLEHFAYLYKYKIE